MLHLTGHSRSRPIQSFGWLILVVLSGWSASAEQPPGVWLTQGDQIALPPGFRAELVYRVPAETQGSWVSMTVDPQGRLIASDQYGKLYRMTVPRVAGEPPQVEPIEVELGHAQGLLCALDSLFVMVNDDQRSGLYRVWDSDGDDRFDASEQLMAIDGAGEHGPHAVVLSPDQQWLYLCAGNHTALPRFDRSFVPTIWDEDHLLPRFMDPQGHAVGIKAPGGWICRIAPDGTRCELMAVGFRNQYDIAFNRQGRLFTFDADMEWDLGSPWYRPTRVYDVVQGVDFGWRSGTAKWPDYFIDTLPAVVEAGPGSPTGICFGYGTKFPARYREALFAADWSMGRLLAVHLRPVGASYKGEIEVFASAAALPLTDLVVNPTDGALYFAVGGRRLQSAVYRIVYEGDAPLSGFDLPSIEPTGEAQLRDRLATLQREGVSRESLDWIWSQMAHADRTVRHMARVALEHQPIHLWKGRLHADHFHHPTHRLTALAALARLGHRNDQPQLLELILQLDPEQLDASQQLDALRVLQLGFIRMGPPEVQQTAIVDWLTRLTSSSDRMVIRELSTLLTYLHAEGIRERLFAWIAADENQEQRIHLLLVLRMLAADFTPAEATRYFELLQEARTGGGGKSYGGYIDYIAADAFGRLSEDNQQRVEPLWQALRQKEFNRSVVDRPFVRQWTVDEAMEVIAGEPMDSSSAADAGLGKRLFVEAQCAACHRFQGVGGALGPDLTHVGGRMGTRDLLTALIEPDHAISDQYRNHLFELNDGRTLTGRIINLDHDVWYINPDMRNPGNLIGVRQSEVERMAPSPVSTMPTGLLDTLSADELKCFIRYLRMKDEG